ncbi:hypothetical protein MDS_1382 [Ectopseudomonas mendocina NK-01]|nr:hypothetical protein MDS_1382 [Pseudomonas mendocina NK-01]
MNTSGSPVVRRGRCRLDRQNCCFHGASRLASDAPQAFALPGSWSFAATGEQSAKAVKYVKQLRRDPPKKRKRYAGWLSGV